MGSIIFCERELKQDLENVLKQRDGEGNLLPLDRSMISGAFTRLVAKLELEPSLVVEPSFAIRTYQWYVIRTTPEPLLLNSFFINDLSLAKQRLLARETGKALGCFLGVTPPLNQIDILEKRSALKELVQPRRTPPARWPSDHSLVLMQQAAINAAVDLFSNEGILGVNGPPGTGKTTILRDLVAAVVAERAESLARFEDPLEAFKHAGQMRMGQAFCHLYTLDGSIKGKEILVASSNNKAVENISRELPGGDAISKESWLEYFRSVSDEALGEENGTWGLIAAVLGNAANRSAFRKAVWDNDDTSLKHYFAAAAGNNVPPIEEKDTNTGKIHERQPRIIELEKPPSGHAEALKRWQKAKKSYESALKRAKRALEMLDKGRRHIEALELLKSGLESTQRICATLKQQVESLAERIKGVETNRERMKMNHDNAIDQAVAHRCSKPWFFSKLFRTQRWRDWAAQRSRLKLIKNDSRVALEAAEHTLANERTQEANLNRQLASELIVLKQKQDQIAQSEKAVLELRKWIGAHVANDDFWSREHGELQIDTPWLAEHIQRQRSAVFEVAIGLHKAFLDAAAKRIRHNLMALFSIFRGTGLGSSERDVLIPDLWSTLFLVSPVISTTFASVDRMLGKLGSEHIGWLMIDEAGQALPQAAVGALMRSKRAVVVGDPLQIQPIVTLPPTLVDAICRDFGVDPDLWAAPASSAQTLADRATMYGTSLEVETGSMWLGTPLLVHRRCKEPMFSLSNRIAYGGNMVYATLQTSSRISDILGTSRWIDVHGTGRTKWCPEEGDMVISMLERLRSAGVDSPDIFVISPFVIVSQEMRRLLVNSGLLSSWTENPWGWAQERVGTVHTFQGKEAEAVVLVLGAPKPIQNGARAWAAYPPNLLNVAITRAKSAVYVVGSRNRWKQHGCYKQLDRLLS